MCVGTHTYACLHFGSVNCQGLLPGALCGARSTPPLAGLSCWRQCGQLLSKEALRDTSFHRPLSSIHFLWLLRAMVKATELYPFTVLEAKSWKPVSLDYIQRHRQGHTLSPSRGESAPCLFQLLAAAGAPWLVATSLPSLHVWCTALPHLCVSTLPLERTRDYI